MHNVLLAGIEIRITLDLDDRVKAGYVKFDELLDGVKLVSGGKDEQ